MKLLPFDIEKAKAGAKIVTRDNREVRIICFDSKTDQPIIALYGTKLDHGEKEILGEFCINGMFYKNGIEDRLDLLLLSEPTYKPFTRETVPSDKWFINHHGDRLRIAEAYLNDCLLGRTSYTYNEILNQFKFEDGSPCGIEE